jgi:transposase
MIKIVSVNIFYIPFLIASSTLSGPVVGGACLPSHFVLGNTVYYYYRKRKNNGFIEEVHELLRDKVRKQKGRQASPILGLINSRSVKTVCNGGDKQGIDGSKKTKGRKQHIITDTLGLILSAVIHAANIHDSKGTPEVIAGLRKHFLQNIWQGIRDCAQTGRGSKVYCPSKRYLFHGLNPARIP